MNGWPNEQHVVVRIAESMLNDICEKQSGVVPMDMLSSKSLVARTVDGFDAWILIDMLHVDILKVLLVDEERIDQFQSIFDRAQIGTWYLHQIDDETIAPCVYLRSETMSDDEQWSHLPVQVDWTCRRKDRRCARHSQD